MGRYLKLVTDVWSDSAIEDLEYDGKYLYLYLLSSPESNLMGYYRIQPRQIASDMGTTKEKILPQLMTETKLWKYDQNTNQVLIPGFLKYNKVNGENQLKGINRELESLQPCLLHKLFFKALRKHCGEEIFGYIDQPILKSVRAMFNVQEKKGYMDECLLESLNKYIK